MSFLSTNFLFVFLPIATLFYYVSPNIKMKNILLIMISLVFYGFGDPISILFLLLYTLINYIFTRSINKFYHLDNRLFFTAVTILFNVLVLLYFKMFITLLGGNAPTIPLGISFFTFQSIAYLVDVYKRKITEQKSIIEFSVFIMFFPKLIAGPIIRYDDIGKQIRERNHSFQLISDGIVRFTIGLSKKVILADLAANLVTSNLGPTMETPLQAWFGLLMFTFQLYFDFSGYSDMAIGLGKIFGFIFPENFNYPYMSLSISQFWRRWHITLGTFFRDYIYIPLGGNKHRHAFNLFVVWIITALWHGVGAGFVMWGVYHFILVFIDKKVNMKTPILVSRTITFLLVYFGWSFFYYGNLEAWTHFMTIAFNINGTATFSNLNLALITNNLPFVLLCAIATTPLLPWISQRVPKKYKQPMTIVSVLCLLMICTSFIYAQSYVPFLYANF